MQRKNFLTDMKFKEYKGLDLAGTAADVLGEWDARDTFHKSIQTREGHPTFVFYEGPPSANGMPGIHHVMARTIKDVFCRYKTQQGYLVHRKAGWDTHGLPVELGVEKKLGITKQDIGKKIYIEEYNRPCREAVMEFTGMWSPHFQQVADFFVMENYLINMYECPEVVEVLTERRVEFYEAANDNFFAGLGVRSEV